MRFVTDEKSQKEYKKFLEGHERCNFQQSLEWAEVNRRRKRKNNRFTMCMGKKNADIWKYDVFIKRTSM